MINLKEFGIAKKSVGIAGGKQKGKEVNILYTKSELMQDIKKMGVDPYGTLLIHSSMKAIGPVEGGAETVLDAWCDYMQNGLLIFPTHTWASIGKERPVYDSRIEPSCVGILPELFRKRPGAFRSLHPTHSVAAMGKEAMTYISGEEKSDSPCPRTGCWGKLLDRDADILFLGCQLRSNTFIHGVEEWNQIPNRVNKETVPLTMIGPKGEAYHIDMHRHSCSETDDISQYYVILEEPFAKLGAIRYGKFGDAKCIIGNARKMEDITTSLLKRDPDLFLHGKIPESWY